MILDDGLCTMDPGITLIKNQLINKFEGPNKDLHRDEEFYHFLKIYFTILVMICLNI